MTPAPDRVQRGFLRRSLFIAALGMLSWPGALSQASAQTAGQAFSNTSIPVTVGYYFDADSMNKSPTGQYRGYNFDYLYEIAKYSNWEYHIVDFDTFQEAYNAVKSGTIDLLPALRYSEQRGRELLFSNQDMGRIRITLLTSAQNSRYLYDDYPSFSGMRVGVLAGGLDGKGFRQFDARKNLHTRIVEIPAEEELFAALERGDLDAIAITYVGNSSSYRIIAEFDPESLFFGMPKKNSALMAQLDSAMDQISINKPDFQAGLYRKYFAMGEMQTPVFSSDEHAYIDRLKKPIRVALQNGNPPFVYTGEDGKIQGAIPDFYNRIAQISGLHFEYIKSPSLAWSIAMLKAKRVDIVATITDDSYFAAANHLRLTNDYASFSLTRIARRRSAGSQLVWAGLPEFIAGAFDAAQGASGEQLNGISYFGSDELCCRALRQGSIDAVYLDSAAANYFINNSRGSDYTVSAVGNSSFAIASAVLQDGDYALYTILNKCMRYMNSTTMDALIFRHSLIQDNSLEGYINRIPLSAIVIFAAVLLLLVVMLFIAIILIIRRQKEKLALSAAINENERKESRLAALEKSEDERNQFFSTISHDMRTPLNAIIGFTDLLNGENLNPKERGYASNIRISSQLLLDLINDTLTISKINGGKLQLRPEPIRNTDLLNAILVPISAAAAEKHVGFAVDRTAIHERIIMADILNTEKIFLNILSNAVKYTQPGGQVQLILRLDPQQSPDPDSILIVRDTGVGISEDFLPHIYEPFAQEQRRGIQSSGTGLGLSIVKRLVDLMGGTIEVQSHKDEGTQFTVRLHFTEVRCGSSQTLSKAQPPAISEPRLRGLRVIVCEDNSLNMEIDKALLESKGIALIAAANGREGVEAFEQSAPYSIDAILMDIRMPVLDGYKATAEIRALARPDAATVPIIAMTADAYKTDVDRSLKAGMNAHIAKPIDPQKLFSTLAEFCNR